MSNPANNPDLVEAFDAPFVYKVDGQEVAFPRFDLDELAELGASIKARRIEETERLADRSQFSAMEKYRAMQEAAWSQVMDGQIYAYVQTPEGAKEVLHRSLQMAGVGVPAYPPNATPDQRAAADRAALEARRAVLRKIHPDTKIHIATVITGVANPVAPKTELRAADGSEPGFGNAEEVEVKGQAKGQPAKDQPAPLPGGSTNPST